MEDLMEQGDSSEEEVQTHELSQQLESIASNKQRKIIRKLARFGNMVAYAFSVVVDDILPCLMKKFKV